MAIPHTAPDPGRCPLCGKQNQCALEIERATGVKQPPCWCTKVQFHPSVLERVQTPARGKVCVCQTCATQ